MPNVPIQPHVSSDSCSPSDARREGEARREQGVSEGDDLTPQEVAWRDHALRSFPFFARSLKIRFKDERDEGEGDGILAPFKWRPAQWIVWYWILGQVQAGVPVYLVILKARQFGVSTFFCCWLFWQMWRSTQTRTFIAVKAKGSTMKAMMETMDRFYQSLPNNFRPSLRAKGAKRVSAEEIYFEDRRSAGYVIAADVPDSARGDAYDHALCTEVGSYNRASDFFGEFTPAMGQRKNTTLVLESTAAPGYFRQRYLRSADHGAACFLPWSVAPELYSRRLIVDHEGRRKTWRDAQSEEKVVFSTADRKEQEFLSRQHEVVLDRIINIAPLESWWPKPEDLLRPVTEEQMWWWKWYCEHNQDGDEEYMRQEFPRDDKSAFERSVISAFKVALPAVRETVESPPSPAKYGVLECLDDICDADIDQHDIRFIETKHGSNWQEREPGIEIYEEWNAENHYAVGVDVADDIGTAQDEDDAAFSVISVYCAETLSQVAEWRGSMDPHELGDEVAKVGYYYNTAIVCVEYNNMGVTCIDRLTKYIQYPNRFKWPILDEAGKLHKKKEMWLTSQQNKQLFIGSFRSAVKNGYFKVRSEGLYEEMMGYQNYDGFYEPGPGEHGDRIIAAALAWQCVTTEQLGELHDIVFGARFKETPRQERKSAAGQAKKFTDNRERSPFAAPPQALPFEMENEDKPQRIEEPSWIFDGAAKGLVDDVYA